MRQFSRDRVDPPSQTAGEVTGHKVDNVNNRFASAPERGFASVGALQADGEISAFDKLHEPVAGRG